MVMEQGNQPGKRAAAHKQVYLRQRPGQFVPVALGKASCYCQKAASTSFLCLRQVQNGIDGFLGGAFDKATGVYHNELSFTWILNRLVAGLHEKAKDDFTVNHVFGTTQTLQVKSGWLHMGCFPLTEAKLTINPG
jgi:hypothetical protein